MVRPSLSSKARKVLADRCAALEGIRRGLADAKAGRMHSRKSFAKAARKRHPYLIDS